MHPKRTIPLDLLDSAALFDRFRSHVAVAEDVNCWPYTGVRNEHGYGRFGIAGRWQYAHRVAWALEHRSNVPEGLRVLHRCDNPPCCNPSHLFLGSQVDNMQDMLTKGRKNMQGTRNGRATLTEQQVLEIRERCRNGEAQNQISREYGVTPGLICSILHYRVWRHVP